MEDRAMQRALQRHRLPNATQTATLQKYSKIFRALGFSQAIYARIIYQRYIGGWVRPYTLVGFLYDHSTVG